MKRIFIVSPMEYGTQTDHFYWCKYLKIDNKVTHISYANNSSNVIDNNLNVVKLKRSKRFRKLKLAFKTVKLINENNIDVIIVDYFPGCFIIKLLSKNKNIILDIRTGSIKKNKLYKRVRDICLKIESLFFKHISIIDKELGDKLNINRQKVKILPLGSEQFVSNEEISKKDKNKLNMLYVGTFIMRNIEKTIYAIRKVCKENEKYKDIQYTLIGSGIDKEYDKSIEKLIEINNLRNNVKFLGRVEHSELYNFLKESNVGISYIPIEDYFDLQPPTKTYEYIINGLFCIGTNTTANRKIINEYNGIVIGDSVDDLANAIKEVYRTISEKNLNEVANSLNEFTWENIVLNKLNNIIEEVLEEEVK